jgi:non-lysosomal glucosylceramidase
MKITARLFFLLIFILISVSCKKKAEQVNVDTSWPVIKHYDSDHLYRIALPLGGIGTGTVSLGGRGELRDWEIMNRPAKGFNTTSNLNNAPFFSIYTRVAGEQPVTKALLGPLYPWEYQHMEGRSAPDHGMPRFEKAEFDAAYPLGQVHLTDSKMPVDVTIRGFNPLIPGQPEASGIPIAILYYDVKNVSDKPLEVAVCGTMRNFIGMDGSKRVKNWKGEYEPVGASHNKNQFLQYRDLQGIFMYSDSVKKDDPAWGTMALSTVAEDTVTYRTGSVPDDWSNAVLNFWDDFSKDGELTERDFPFDNQPMASLAVRDTVYPGETRTFRFFITWDFPNRTDWAGKEIVGNYYPPDYANGWDVAKKIVPNVPMLEQGTVKFIKTLINTKLPEPVLEAALFNLSTLRSQTVFRTADGKLFGWEGTMDDAGSCWGSCTHVWNYEQVTPFLFGKLAKTMREVEFGYATDTNGLMSFRVGLPLKNAQSMKVAAADGQMGTIMKFYRDWQISGDNEFLGKYWPKVKAALSFCWIPGGWDANKDGVMEGIQHNTMDVEYYGPNPQMELWYLGALRAAEEMSYAVKDSAFAKVTHDLFLCGSEWTDKNLFNGEYYEQIVMVPDDSQPGVKGFSAGMGSVKKKKPDYQLGKGCLVDQLVGQYMAHICGLGYLVKEENIKNTLNSILKYNYRPAMNDHFNNMRSFALGNESGLLMASWPKGRPEVPFPYFSEVMPGFEYTAAAGMFFEGMTAGGIKTITDIRKRYDGLKRNPFDEAECGYHYVRSMASWASVIALTGFNFSGVTKTMQINSEDGSYFWCNGYSWGNCTVSGKGNTKEVKMEVFGGSLELKEFKLKNFGGRILRDKDSLIIKSGEVTTFTVFKDTGI